MTAISFEKDSICVSTEKDGIPVVSLLYFNANVLVHNALIITVYQYVSTSWIGVWPNGGWGAGGGGSRIWIFVANSGAVIDKLFLL